MSVITSESKKNRFWRYISAQVRYAVTYMIITTVVLAFLNLYCARVNEQLFYQNKKSTLTEKANLLAAEISSADELNRLSIYNAVKLLDIHLNRVLVLDADGTILYDTGDGTLPPEILSSGTQFSWDYSGGVMTSAVSVPITADRQTCGYVYLLEIDSSDGKLLHTLQMNILTITVTLEVVLLLFAVFFVTRYSRRLKTIMGSMRIIQNGDFTHKIKMDGRDELAFLAKEFNYLTERLQTSENKRRQFVSDASHELKTPLASIKILSDTILQNDMDMETVREFAGDIGDEADRLTRMTNKLLALTKGEANTAMEDPEIMYMAPTIQGVVKMLDGIARKNQITIDLDLRQDNTILVQADDLYQITFNLVENGIKYNVPGGSLSISLHRQEDMAVMRIQDTGVGIPPEAIGHVFERFYRVDKARSRQSGGSGLGLAIVRNMVERNNGVIHLQSTVGKGTVFTVSFPCFDISPEEIESIVSEEEE